MLIFSITGTAAQVKAMYYFNQEQDYACVLVNVTFTPRIKNDFPVIYIFQMEVNDNFLAERSFVISNQSCQKILLKARANYSIQVLLSNEQDPIFIAVPCSWDQDREHYQNVKFTLIIYGMISVLVFVMVGIMGMTCRLYSSYKKRSQLPQFPAMNSSQSYDDWQPSLHWIFNQDGTITYMHNPIKQDDVIFTEEVNNP